MSTFLRVERRHRALSVAEVARQLDVHPNSVLRWERRDRLPGPQHLKAIAAVLDVDVSAVVRFFDVARPPAAAVAGLRGHGLRPLRRAADVPVRHLAARLGVPPATVYNWESGRVRIPDEHLPGLGATLGTTVDHLVHHLTVAPVEQQATPVSRLRRLRRRSGLSQEAVARRIGTTRHRLGAWERGEQPPIWAVRRMAAVYGVPVAQVASVAGVRAPGLLDRRRWSAGDLPGVLVALRGWNGLTQREVARRCGCDVTSVRAWEKGRSTPLPRFRERLERVYGLPVDALLAAWPESG